jgi:hypothetical protein
MTSQHCTAFSSCKARTRLHLPLPPQSILQPCNATSNLVSWPSKAKALLVLQLPFPLLRQKSQNMSQPSKTKAHLLPLPLRNPTMRLCKNRTRPTPQLSLPSSKAQQMNPTTTTRALQSVRRPATKRVTRASAQSSTLSPNPSHRPTSPPKNNPRTLSLESSSTPTSTTVTTRSLAFTLATSSRLCTPNHSKTWTYWKSTQN